MTQPDDTPPTTPPRWWQHGAGRAALLAAALATLAAVVWVSATWDLSGQHPISPVLAPAPVAVAPGVFLLGKLTPSAAYAVDTSAGLVLVDAGQDADASSVRDQLKDLGLDVARLKAVLLTHAHGDHTLGAAHLRSLTGAPLHAGRGDAPPLRDGGPREAFFSTFHRPEVPLHKTPIDVELTGGEQLPFGDSTFQVIAAPGHSTGSVCYLLERGGQRILFTGDVVQALGQATAGALGTYTAYLPPLYRGNARDYLASLRKLRALPTPDLVLPGHPRDDNPPQSPRLGEARWRALLDGGIAEMERLLARFEADGTNFLDGTPRVLRPGLYYLGNAGEAALYAVKGPKGLVVLDAPGDGSLPRLLTERLAALGVKDPTVAAVLLTSASPGATAGLADLVRAAGCKVVVGKEGVDAVRALCPKGTEVLAAEDVAARGADAPVTLPQLRVVPLAGLGVAPVAYLFRWADRTVLASGRIPVKPSVPSSQRVIREVTGPGGNVAAYLKSLTRLTNDRPDVWLPAIPVHGQNANLYDGDWGKVIAHNRYYFSQ